MTIDKRDSVLRIDYIKHMIAGFLISGLTAFVIHIWSCELMILSAVVAFGVGVAKELIWDKLLGRGTFEWKDIYFTCWGGALATILWYFL